MDRKTPYRNGDLIAVPLAANTQIYAGHMVAINNNGYAIAASDKAGISVVGIANEHIDNTGGTDGAQAILIRRQKVFCLANSSSAPVTQTEAGKSCFVSDSQTVKKSGDVLAGKVLLIDADGVWVEI